MAFCVELFKYIWYSENKSFETLCLWTPICHWCSLDGWTDRDVYTLTVALFSDEHPVAFYKSADTRGQGCLKGRFTKNCSRGLGRRTVGCYEDILGRSWACTEAFLCFQCGRTLTSSEH